MVDSKSIWLKLPQVSKINLEQTGAKRPGIGQADEQTCIKGATANLAKDLQSNNVHLYKEIALTDYNLSSQNLLDTACAQFLKSSFGILDIFQDIVNFENEAEKRFYKDIGASSWCADLETAIELRPSIKEFIFSYGLSQKATAYEMFVNAAFSKSVFFYISSNVDKSNVIEINSLCDLVMPYPPTNKANRSTNSDRAQSGRKSMMTGSDRAELKSNIVKIDLIFIYIEDNSELTINFNNNFNVGRLSRIVAFLGKSAKVKFIHEDNFASEANSIQSFDWYLDEGANLEILHKLSSSNLNVVIQNFYLTGNNSSTDYQARVGAKENNNIVTLITQSHKGVNTKSNVSLKSITADSSRLFSRGKIEIGHEAIGTQASLELITLSTSSKARNCAIPTLEVKNSKVNCRHASATGSVNDEHLWYLQSRGFDQSLAGGLIVNGFLNFDFKTESQDEVDLINKLKQKLVI